MYPKMKITALAFCAIVSGTAIDINAKEPNDKWLRFRGENGAGVVAAADTPIEFNLTKGVVWKSPIEGKGWSSPVVSDGMIWVTTSVEQTLSEEEVKKKLSEAQLQDNKKIAGRVKLYAVALDATSGKQLHKIELAEVDDPEPINLLNTYASPTPVIDGANVICHFGRYGTWCLEAKTGKIVWHNQVVIEHSVGPGSSPVLCDDVVVLVCDGTDQQFVAALNRKTGEMAWKTDRPPLKATNPEFKKAYSTPIVIEVNGKKQIVAPGAQWICAYDPKSGLELWRIDHGEGFSTSPSAVYSHGLVIFSTGYMRPELVAVRPDGTGDVTATHIAWRANRGAPNKPSPLVIGDHVYMMADNGILTQLSVTDGKELWRERLAGNFSASPIAAGNRVYIASQEGMVTVFEAGETFKKLAENELEGRLMATPAVLGDDLIIRSEESVMRISK